MFLSHSCHRVLLEMYKLRGLSLEEGAGAFARLSFKLLPEIYMMTLGSPKRVTPFLEPWSGWRPRGVTMHREMHTAILSSYGWKRGLLGVSWTCCQGGFLRRVTAFSMSPDGQELAGKKRKEGA